MRTSFHCRAEPATPLPADRVRTDGRQPPDSSLARRDDGFAYSDDSELELDVRADSARLRLSGTLGLKSAAALRIMLAAMEHMAAPLVLEARAVRECGPHVPYVLAEADRRRRSLGLPSLRLDVGSAAALKLSVSHTCSGR